MQQQTSEFPRSSCIDLEQLLCFHLRDAWCLLRAHPLRDVPQDRPMSVRSPNWHSLGKGGFNADPMWGYDQTNVRFAMLAVLEAVYRGRAT